MSPKSLRRFPADQKPASVSQGAIDREHCRRSSPLAGHLGSSHEEVPCCYGCKPASECRCFLEHIQEEVACLCGVSEPDSFGNRDLLEHPDCPLHGEAA